jgi:predicted PurR-regulated permease PerM
MDLSQRAPLWVIAAGVIAAGLYFLREPLTQFAMALILWLAIDGLAETLDKRIKILPRWLALPIALVLVLSLVALVGFVVVQNLGAMAGDYATYETRINAILAEGYAILGLGGQPPTLANLIARLDPAQIASELGQGLRSMASDVMFTLIFLGFMFSAAAMMSRKLDFIFPGAREREGARDVVHRIRLSMERYLWVQTVVSVIITLLTYITLMLIGVNNALFWSFVIFFLNYIPTIGSIVATIVAVAAALVQFDALGPILATGIGVGAWQFLVGNFLQPRMTGDSLNLAAVVVLLALAIWGSIWGIAGAFLAAPLTVMLMIVLAQFESTRWIAILLSADGNPMSENGALSNPESQAK